jgi:hypothetical protein
LQNLVAKNVRFRDEAGHVPRLRKLIQVVIENRERILKTQDSDHFLIKGMELLSLAAHELKLREAKTVTHKHENDQDQKATDQSRTNLESRKFVRPFRNTSQGIDRGLVHALNLLYAPRPHGTLPWWR